MRRRRRLEGAEQVQPSPFAPHRFVLVAEKFGTTLHGLRHYVAWLPLEPPNVDWSHWTPIRRRILIDLIRDYILFLNLH